MYNDNESKTGKLVAYIVTNVICITFVLIHLFRFDFFNETELTEKYRLLADAFVIPGSLSLLITALIAVSNMGSLDAIGFMLKRFGQMILPFTKKTHERYSDYVDKKKRVSGYGFLGWSGLVYFVIGLIFTVLFYTVY